METQYIRTAIPSRWRERQLLLLPQMFELCKKRILRLALDDVLIKQFNKKEWVWGNDNQTSLFNEVRDQ